MARDRKPAVFGYCSVLNATAPEAALADQRRDVEAYYQKNLSHLPAAAIVGDHWKGDRKLEWRPEGGRLIRSLVAGDHLIFHNAAHVWRNLKQMVKSIQELEARGVTVHVIDMGINSASVMGKVVMDTLVRAGLYVWQRQQIKLATASVTHTLNRPKKAYPYLYSLKKRCFYRSDALREFARQVIQWHDVEKFTLKEIWLKCLKEKRKPIKAGNNKKVKEWSLQRITELYQLERHLQIIEDAYPDDFKLPKYLKIGMEDPYRGPTAQRLGIRAPARRATEFPLVNPTLPSVH